MAFAQSSIPVSQILKPLTTQCEHPHPASTLAKPSKAGMPYSKSSLYFVTAQKGLGSLRMLLHLLRYVNLICNSGPNQERVTVKTAPSERLNREVQMLRHFQGHGSIRQLVDQIEDPASVVLEYMDDNVLSLLKRKQLPKVEAKRALKATFKALTALHDHNIVHTGTFQKGAFA
jgi:serine/threonine protein kinase